MTLHNLSKLSNKLRFAFNDETKQIHVIRVTPGGEEDLGAIALSATPLATEAKQDVMIALLAT